MKEAIDRRARPATTTAADLRTHLERTSRSPVRPSASMLLISTRLHRELSCTREWMCKFIDKARREPQKERTTTGKKKEKAFDDQPPPCGRHFFSSIACSGCFASLDALFRYAGDVRRQKALQVQDSQSKPGDDRFKPDQFLLGERDLLRAQSLSFFFPSPCSTTTP